MTKMLAMFPGQGSQFVGMGKKLVQDFPYAAKLFEEAEDAAGIHIRKLCFEGPESALVLTANTQPCILATSIAIWHVLREEAGLAPNAFAGHSLGEYAALVASGKMQFAIGAMLVRRRGEFMQNAVPAGEGAMAAILNAEPKALESLCAKIMKKMGSGMVVEIANYNASDQLVVAGHGGAVKALVETLSDESSRELSMDGKSLRAIMLPVSAPFHTSLMKPAREAMTPLLESSLLTQNEAIIIPNVTAVPTESYTVDLLIKQIDHPVRWSQTLATALASEFDQFIEIGPGKVLVGLARRSLPRERVKLIASDDIGACIGNLIRS